MARPLGTEMLDAGTPPEVVIRTEARAPVEDPTLGIEVAVPREGRPRNRLVTLGDSLTQGFQSGAIFHTDVSWPMIVAWEMGWDDQLRHPTYPGCGGLPLNIEYLIRDLEREYGERITAIELVSALFRVRRVMSEIEDFWERGAGRDPPPLNTIFHNLAIYGWDLRDTLSRHAGICAAAIGAPRNNLLAQVVESANDRAALRVLSSAVDAQGAFLPPVAAAAALGREGTEETPGAGDGIELLVVMLGANNALGSVVRLDVRWSEEPAYRDLTAKTRFTVWNPVHFAAELATLADAVSAIRARHVIWATVPHVTIAPIARGVGTKVQPGSRYFPYYTRPWIADADFDPSDDPHLTHQQARAIDSAIDQYNQAITETVRRARLAGRDWYVLELAGLMDRLACRRYIEDPEARPSWWRPYPLPAALAALDPVPDSRFFGSGPTGRTAGGLFSLDGVHPTTIAYGVLAQEVIRIAERAGIKLYMGNGVTERPPPVEVDFARLVAADTLIAAPPRSLGSDIHLVGWLDQKVDFVSRLLRAVV